MRGATPGKRKIISSPQGVAEISSTNPLQIPPIQPVITSCGEKPRQNTPYSTKPSFPVIPATHHDAPEILRCTVCGGGPADYSRRQIQPASSYPTSIEKHSRAEPDRADRRRRDE